MIQGCRQAYGVSWTLTGPGAQWVMMKGGASLPTEPIPSSHQMINPAETADQVKEGGSPRWSSESVVRFAFGFGYIGGEGGPVGGSKTAPACQLPGKGGNHTSHYLRS